MTIQTTVTLENASPELIAQINALIEAAKVQSTVVTREIISENICGFLNLSVDQSKKAEALAGFDLEEAKQATQLRNRRNNASQLANIL